MANVRLGIAWMGKTKSAAAQAWTEEYVRRLGGFSRLAQVRAEGVEGKHPQAALLRRAAGARLWLLDPGGERHDSPGFARFLERQAAAFNQETLLAVGGADGFDPEVRGAAAGLVSLSPLTLSHELARVVLLEQVYRALAILSGHPYPH